MATLATDSLDVNPANPNTTVARFPLQTGYGNLISGEE
ncbi:hypothetical protein J2S41_006584 [Catenuloplanes atrovinosus]|uniref:Uncharacterized protein n=1 Tax=Catenuloplanes atrovinosus TaxID=137266 RepID=A0AAE4CCN2_9ACTN|nr:hypothetical protein [Catenuloplanes atrovinosus]